MKKLLVLLLAAALLLAGCGEDAPAETVPLPGDGGNTGAVSGARGPAAAGELSVSAPALHESVAVPTGEVVEIPEKLFIAQTNDIYLNGEDYLGKTIKYEGIYKNSAEWEDGRDEVLHFVIRYGPGCCGYDGEAGFEVQWDGEWPAPDDWVAVEGILREEAYESGYRLLYLEVTSLVVKEERGAEYVAT